MIIMRQFAIDNNSGVTMSEEPIILACESKESVNSLIILVNGLLLFVDLPGWKKMRRFWANRCPIGLKTLQKGTKQKVQYVTFAQNRIDYVLR